jgi:hypothetical protein
MAMAGREKKMAASKRSAKVPFIVNPITLNQGNNKRDLLAMKTLTKGRGGTAKPRHELAITN